MEYASNGKANAGLTLGIIGTALSGLLWANGGGNGNGLGSILGGNGGTTRQQNLVSGLESQVAELKAMRYTDQVGLDLYRNIITQSNVEDAKINANMKEVMSYIVDLSKEVALNKQAAYYDSIITNNRIDCCCEKAAMQADFNRQLGKIADEAIITYVNNKFIPGTLVLSASNICPPVQLASSSGGSSDTTTTS